MSPAHHRVTAGAHSRGAISFHCATDNQQHWSLEVVKGRIARPLRWSNDHWPHRHGDNYNADNDAHVTARRNSDRSLCHETYIRIFTLSLAAQCIVIGPVCNGRAGGRALFVALWVCYHDNSKLRASIFIKLGLWVKVVTVSSWLNFGRPGPPGRRSAVGRNFWFRLTTASAHCLRLSGRFFSFISILFSSIWLISCFLYY